MNLGPKEVLFTQFSSLLFTLQLVCVYDFQPTASVNDGAAHFA